MTEPDDRDAILFYRCRWCGKVFSNKCGKTFGYFASAIDPDGPNGTTVHQCGEQRIGVADIIGVRPELEYGEDDS